MVMLASWFKAFSSSYKRLLQLRRMASIQYGAGALHKAIVVVAFALSQANAVRVLDETHCDARKSEMGGLRIHSVKREVDKVNKGSTMPFVCEEGYMLATKHDRLNGESGDAIRNTTLRCYDDLKLYTDDATKISFDDLQCLRYCGPFNAPADSGLKAVHVWGIPELQGSVVKFDASFGSFMLGSSKAVCSMAGTYEVQGKPPVVVQRFDIDEIYTTLKQKQVDVISERLVDPPFDQELYKAEIQDYIPAAPDRDFCLQGTEFELSCKDKGVIPGGNRLRADTAVRFKRDLRAIQCADHVRFKVLSVDLGGIVPAAEVSYFKLKLFSGSADVTKKTYEAQAKLKANEVGGTGAAFGTTRALDDTFLHITVCAAKGDKQGMTSNCKVGAATPEPAKCPDCSVASMLRKTIRGVGLSSLSFPVNVYKGYDSTENPTINVTVIFDSMVVI